MTFCSHDDSTQSKFIVLADGRKEAIDMACNVGLEHIKPTPKSLNEILAQMGEEGANGNGVVGSWRSRLPITIRQIDRVSTGNERRIGAGAVICMSILEGLAIFEAKRKDL